MHRTAACQPHYKLHLAHCRHRLHQLRRMRCAVRQSPVEGLLYVFTLKVLMHGIFVTVHYQSFTLDANIAGQNRRVKKYLIVHNFV